MHSGMGRSHNRGYNQILRSLESSEQVPPTKRILGSLAKLPPSFLTVPDSHKEEVLVLWLQDLYALPISSSAHSERARLTIYIEGESVGGGRDAGKTRLCWVPRLGMDQAHSK